MSDWSQIPPSDILENRIQIIKYPTGKPEKSTQRYITLS